MESLYQLTYPSPHTDDDDDDDDDDNPIVISATGIIPKSLSQSLKRLNLHPNTYIQILTVAILGTCSIVRIS
jgi:hypothetical protein